MGSAESSPVDESVPPRTLAGRTIDALASYILYDYKSTITTSRSSFSGPKIVVLTGAGISTSAGIPDFRSPETGLYANLARLNLPYAEAVFDISYFRENPEPFYALAHELYPGKYRPTIAHSFVRLLHEKGLLLKEFTQNIDCLSREAGVPQEKIVEAHGSFARQSCIECRADYPNNLIRKHIAEKTIPRCEQCGGLVKPEIVFFGEQLPADFLMNRTLVLAADLVIILGTSLTVQPFASLPGMTRPDAPRVLINKERVGGIGSRPDDVLILGDCDDGVRKLAEACGWLEELEHLWAETAKPEYVNHVVQKKNDEETDGKTGGTGRILEDEIEKLTREIDETLNLSRWHTDKVRSETLGETPNSKSTSVVGGDPTYEDKNGNLDHVFISAPKTVAASGNAHGEQGTKPKI